jgi:hypothetical protein
MTQTGVKGVYLCPECDGPWRTEPEDARLDPTEAPKQATLPTNPLDVPIDQDDVDNCPTIGHYLADLLTTLLDQGEGFDSRSPFGNEDWLENIDRALIAAGYGTTSELYDAIDQALTGPPTEQTGFTP